MRNARHKSGLFEPCISFHESAQDSLTEEPISARRKCSDTPPSSVDATERWRLYSLDRPSDPFLLLASISLPRLAISNLRTFPLPVSGTSAGTPPSPSHNTCVGDLCLPSTARTHSRTSSSPGLPSWSGPACRSTNAPTTSP